MLIYSTYTTSGRFHYDTIKSPDVTRLPRSLGNSMDRDCIIKKMIYLENGASEAEKQWNLDPEG